MPLACANNVVGRAACLTRGLFGLQHFTAGETPDGAGETAAPLPGGLDPFGVRAGAEILVAFALVGRSRDHAVYEPVPFDLDGVKYTLVRVLFQDELDAAIEGREPLELGVGPGAEAKVLRQIMLHRMALAPGTAGGADEGLAVEQGDRVVVGGTQRL